jgi:hypothetical protein
MPSNVPQGLTYFTIQSELRRFNLFEEGNPHVSAGLTDEKRLELFTEMIENLHAKEAVVLVNAFLKKEKVPGLTYKLVKEAFPELLP